MKHYSTVIIVAGPAGLTAAYELIKQGIQPIVLEKAHKVGGLPAQKPTKATASILGGIAFIPN